MTDRVESGQTRSTPDSARLHYLDWLRVLAILMVFLFHAVHPFDYGDWQVKNVEQSEIISIILTLLGLWGMPFFFLVAGGGAWFALLRRTPRQYIRERFYRLLIPLIIGTILFSPLEMYMEWANHVQRGVWTVTFREYALRPPPADNLLSIISPRWFGYGFHLWFLGFLFSFALITLPLFLWLKKEQGQRVISWMATLSERRGGLLLLVIPLGLIYSLLWPPFPEEHDWADFIFQMSFFALGFLLFSDPRFSQTIQKQWRLLLGVPTAAVVGLVGMYLAELPVMEWGETPGIAQFYLIQFLRSAIALCYSLIMLYVGMRFLNFTNRWLRYGQEAALPFFVVHQPVIIAVAFYVVQWNLGISIKLPMVVLGSFGISVGLYEVIRRVRLLRFVFGMKARVPERQPAGTA
jgi:glucan biosynthesis protein C